MALVRVDNIGKEYGSEDVKTIALAGVSFQMQKGEFVSIMGPSGSGKSTLMQILGLLDEASYGTYYFDDRNIEEYDEDDRASLRNESIGFIFQSFNLLPRTSVFENVKLPLLYDQRKINKRAINDQKVLNALDAVGMSHRINHHSNQLSGGEKQRVAIARALVNDPDLVFADEPTGNLDSKSGHQVMKILQELNNKGKTIILVTHESYTAQHASRILRMMDGKIVGDESVKERRIAEGEETLIK